MDRYLVQKINHEFARFEWVESCTYIPEEGEESASVTDIVWTETIGSAFDFETETDASSRARLIENSGVVRSVGE